MLFLSVELAASICNRPKWTMHSSHLRFLCMEMLLILSPSRSLMRQKLNKLEDAPSE